jgi:proline dehydrogenase
VRAAGRALARRASARYTAGPDVEDAVRAIDEAARHGAGATIGAWTGPDVGPEEATDRHLDAVRAVAEGRIDAVVAIKTGALDHRPELVATVVAAARDGGAEVCFDAHGPGSAEPTLDAAAAAAEVGHPAVGVALPSRWARSLQDARDARASGRIVRLVKGQWGETTGADRPPAAGMVALAGALHGHDRTVRVATHDPALAAAVVAQLRPSPTPVEIELLLGLPLRATAAVARSLGVPVRLYVPFGAADVPYDASEARTSPSVALRLVRDAARRR